MSALLLKEEFEDTIGVIRFRISKKNRQHNDQKKKYKRKNNDPQNIYMYIKLKVTRIPLKSRGELRCPGRVSSSCSTRDFNLTKGNHLQALLTTWPAGLYMNEELGQVNQEVYTKSSMLRSCNITIDFQFKVRLVLLCLFVRPVVSDLVPTWFIRYMYY